jgi:hypothetical protein
LLLGKTVKSPAESRSPNVPPMSKNTNSTELTEAGGESHCVNTSSCY